MFILVFIFTIFILVVIHELGHFFVARWSGVKVLEFGFGIPPRVFGKMYRGTLISLNWIPFGGFVRLFGEDEVDEKTLKMKNSFAAKSVLTRIAIVVAGVFMNLILAWILFYIVIISQNFRILYPSIEPSISVASIEKDYPAAKSGLMIGDKILSVNGQKVNSLEETVKAIRSTKKGQSVQITYSDIDGGSLSKTSIVPKEVTPGNPKIGVVFTPIPVKVYETPAEKIFSGITYSYDAAKYTFIGLGRLFSDLGNQNYARASQSVSGPIGIIAITRDIVNQGSEAFLFYLWFMGIMSLTLAIFNILPIPALDGGRFFFLLVELVTRKKPNAAFERNVHAVGMALLLTLLVLISIMDARRLDLLGKISQLFS